VLDAQQALDWGLVNQVVEDQNLAETAAALAARLAAGPVGAFGARPERRGGRRISRPLFFPVDVAIELAVEVAYPLFLIGP
jgi:enoyl-CoA hydratase/carnithine racemase